MRAERLTGQRPKAVSHLLKPISYPSEVGCTLVPGRFVGGRVIAAGAAAGDESDYRTYRFKSAPTEKRLFSQYFELWKPSDANEVFQLDRAYLTIAQMDQEHLLQPIISLHCDPNPSADEIKTRGSTTRYKMGPHLHLEFGKDPLKNAHFPLNLGHLDRVLKSDRTLTTAFRMAVSVLASEVISLF